MPKDHAFGLNRFRKKNGCYVYNSINFEIIINFSVALCQTDSKDATFWILLSSRRYFKSILLPCQVHDVIPLNVLAELLFNSNKYKNYSFFDIKIFFFKYINFCYFM